MGVYRLLILLFWMVNVFPTPVGVYRLCFPGCFAVSRFPHARGGVPRQAAGFANRLKFSPRPWGCTVKPEKSPFSTIVFPTPVGMYRQRIPSLPPKPCFPHARGDVPGRKGTSWRGMRFPHARGGVPPFCNRAGDETQFSPRPWGCTAASIVAQLRKIVFPTPVGVYRRTDGLERRAVVFPALVAVFACFQRLTNKKPPLRRGLGMIHQGLEP